MSNVGYATLQIIPSTQGFGRALNRGVNPTLGAAGAAGGRRFGSGLMGAIGGKAIGLAAAGAMIGSFTKSSITAAADFGKTMNLMGATADVPAAGIKRLSALAMKMGADTVFSAQDAADAMLELAKGGVKPATIESGALASTLTLATAGGLELGSAATYMSNALNGFNLKGSQAGSVAAALAGGANASTASVESLGMALGQVGPGAVNAGLSLQQTVGVLSAFDNAGIKGSDAGTSLKTMLARLVPQTDKAAGAMKKLGLDFVDAQGNFVPITNVAQQLKDKLGGLSEAQRSTALTTIFGSDASRAAAVLMKEGASGIGTYIKATQDQGAAQRVADAAMSGSAGAIERMKGSLDTAKLAFGRFIEPATIAGANGLSKVFDALAPVLDKIGAAFSSGGKGASFLSKAIAYMTPYFNQLKAQALPVLTQLGATIKTAFQDAGPIIQFFGNVFKIVFPMIFAQVKFYMGAIMNIIRGALQIIQGVIQVFSGLLTGNWSKVWDGIKNIVMGALRLVWGLFNIWFLGRIAGIMGSLVGRLGGLMGSAMRGLLSAAGRGLSSVYGLFRNAPSLIVRGLAALAGLLGRLAIAALSAMGRGVTSGLRTVIGFFTGLPGRIGSALASLPGKMVSIGGNIMSGIAHGITGGAGQLISSIKHSVTDALPGFVKKALGIHSPSRVFMGFGHNISQGMAIGIEKGAPKVMRAMSGITSISEGAGASAANGASQSGGPLVGSLTLQSGGSVRDDLAEVDFYLRRAARGGIRA